ncbi:LLM class flavin-dependent oxidoreductase [Kitasatospora sp. NBC_00458]|uniref:LLM class flavin-dependent oxidoreductase n=1 Tax=Kitasatospora sp. NBC_00458 TaxID=2903568 RepID=UPI002E17E1E6
MPQIKIGVFAPALTFDPVAPPGETAEVARFAEQLGFESLWVSGHLTGRCAMPDPLQLLTVAAAATTELAVGTAALVPGLYPLPLLAQQLATLQYLSADRLLLGVDAGDSPWARWRGGLRDGAAWRMLGIPREEADARLDAALEAFPALLRGEPGRLDPVQPEVTLGIPAGVPPLLVGGESPTALRRAARYGDHWFPALASPAWLAEGRARLAELAEAEGRAMPGVTVAQPVALARPGAPAPAGPVSTAALTELYGLTAERGAAVTIGGTPEAVAGRIAEFEAAGADRIVFSVVDPAWRPQFELLAEAVALLGRADGGQHRGRARARGGSGGPRAVP